MSSSPRTLLETILRRERAVVVVALVLITIMAWVYTLAGAGMKLNAFEMTAMVRSMGMEVMAWSPVYAALIFMMWWIMMIAMMLPSAAPMLLMFAKINRARRKDGTMFVPTAVFLAGYLAIWAFFSLIATLMQWLLGQYGLMSPAMSTSSMWLGAAILLAAGCYQFSTIKYVCLRHCRHPIQFITVHWRDGTAGAFRMGLVHGAFCLGCCWFLMGLLFFGGVMNVYWIAGLAIYVLAEKLLPLGHWLGYAAGAALCLAGGALVVANLVS